LSILFVWLVTRRRTEVDTVEEVLEQRLINDETGRPVFVARRDPEGSFVEPLVEAAKPRTGVAAYFQGLFATSEEHKHGPASRRTSESLRDHAHQSFKPPSEIDGFEAHEDLHPVRHHDLRGAANPPRTSRPTRRVPASMFFPTRTRAGPTSSTSEPADASSSPTRTKRASSTGRRSGLGLMPSFFKRPTQYRRALTEYSRPDTNSDILKPLDCQSATRRSHILLSAAMTPSLPPRSLL